MDLEKLKVTKPCHEDWSRMQGDAQRRFCGSCNKHVHDLSAMTEAEAEAVSAKGGLCVRYAVDARGRVLHASALLGLALASPALASTDPQPDSVPWWTRAAQAVQDWWSPPQPEPQPLPEPEPVPQYEEIEERHFTMGDLPARMPSEEPPAEPVQITLAAGAPAFTSIEVNCEETGFRRRAPFPSPGTGTTTLPDVPGGETCRLFFKGGPPLAIPVQAGDDLLCSFVGTVPTCKEM